MRKDKPKGYVTVVGGGISGIEASLSLSNLGYGVYLVEQGSPLGGLILDLHQTYPLCICCKMDPRIAACQQDPNIEVLLESKVLGVSGEKGGFTVSLESQGEKKSINSGALVLAAGVKTFEPTNYETYAYGKHPNVMTSIEYEKSQKPLGPNQGSPRIHEDLLEEALKRSGLNPSYTNQWISEP